MQIPLQISYHHCDASEALSALIRERAAELERFHPNLVSCHVVVERAGEHHRHGKGAHFRVRIELTVPGDQVVVSRDPEQRTTGEDPHLAVSEAFHAARRQLQDLARRRRGDTKAHQGSAHGWVKQLYPERGFGFLETAEGRSIYFHHASVLEGGFAHLTLGDEVRFTEESGEEGPQASSVQRLGGRGHHEVPSQS
jgi:cold shock CspA family protein/ribosome-associated translation inhibitor RaiA